MDAALPESAADEENCSWMTRWMSDKVSMLRANFPGESLNEIYKNLLSQRDLPPTSAVWTCAGVGQL